MDWRQSIIPQYQVNENGEVRNKKTFRILKPTIKNGYYAVGSHKKNTTIRQQKVHRLVCIAFHGPPQNNEVCDHKDGNKLNNRADNLRWCDSFENSRKGNTPLEVFQTNPDFKS
jgi:HNH endonuclease